jgi:osmotically-inducible protein OsmY
MKLRRSIATAATALALVVSGCAVTRGQEGPGTYADDAAITTEVKAKFVGNKEINAASIKVETMKGTVLLSGFAKSSLEKDTAERLALETKGVKNVRNDILVRP